MTDPRKKLTGPAPGGHAASGGHVRAGTPSHPHGKPSALMAGGKGKPPAPARRPGTAPAKPAAKPAARPETRPDAKPAKAPMKPMAKTGAKPTAKPAAKPATKPAPPKAPAALNKGAAAAKALAEKKAAERAEAAAKRAPKLVPATANAVRPGAAKAPPAKGKSAPKPPAEVRPLGVLPPEAMAKAKPAPTHSRVVIPEPRSVRVPRPAAGTPAAPSGPRPGAPAPTATSRTSTRGDDRLSEQDLKHFETRLLEERARIMREMGHFENTLLKVNPRDSAGDVGGYSFHMADAGTDSMEREISFDIASKEGRLMREIDDALRRIYNGVYGICEASGLPIPRARLEALPWARYTIREQENIEKQQRAGRLTKEEE